MSDSKEYVSRSDELGNIHISEEVLAAISAEGMSSVTDLSHIDRGYSGFEYKLASLGAKIRRIRV